MTRDIDELKIENKIVVSFDICSSSNIIEDLTLTNNLQAMRNLLIKIKKFLIEKSETLNFVVYKFTGDGWILLFPEDIPGRDLMRFLTDLSISFKHKWSSNIISLLETPPVIMGITFGIDGGQLIKIVMMEKQEYIGRPLNIACRLQNAIKDNDSHPEYKILVSKHVYKKYLKGLDQYYPRRATRNLRNIRGGNKYQCIKLRLPFVNCK